MSRTSKVRRCGSPEWNSAPGPASESSSGRARRRRRGAALSPSNRRGTAPSMLSVVSGGVVALGSEPLGIATPGSDAFGMAPPPGSVIGTAVPGTTAAEIASGMGGAESVAPGADALGIGAPGRDIGTATPGITDAGIASGMGGAESAAPGADALGIGAAGRDIGTAVPGIIDAGIASGTGGAESVAPGCDALGIGTPRYRHRVHPAGIAPDRGRKRCRAAQCLPAHVRGNLVDQRAVDPGQYPRRVDTRCEWFGGRGRRRDDLAAIKGRKPITRSHDSCQLRHLRGRPARPQSAPRRRNTA